MATRKKKVEDVPKSFLSEEAQRALGTLEEEIKQIYKDLFGPDSTGYDYDYGAKKVRELWLKIGKIIESLKRTQVNIPLNIP